MREEKKKKKKAAYQVVGKKTKKSCKNTFNVLPYEGIVHDVAVICFQNLLKFSDVIILIGTSEKKKKPQETELLFLKVKQNHKTF